MGLDAGVEPWVRVELSMDDVRVNARGDGESVEVLMRRGAAEALQGVLWRWLNPVDLGPPLDVEFTPTGAAKSCGTSGDVHEEAAAAMGAHQAATEPPPTVGDGAFEIDDPEWEVTDASGKVTSSGKATGKLLGPLGDADGDVVPRS